MNILYIITVILVILFLVHEIYPAWYFKKEAALRLGTAYYALKRSERERVRRFMRSHSYLVTPLLKFSSLFRKKSIPSFEYKGFHGPLVTCSRDSFEKAHSYQADENDIFIATQMKSGTTFMLQVIFELLQKGQGDLSDQGFKHLHAVASWIEARYTVDIHDAPEIADRKIIKTHLPFELVPFSEKAKYIYVIRDPASCFASVLDYLKL